MDRRITEDEQTMRRKQSSRVAKEEMGRRQSKRTRTSTEQVENKAEQSRTSCSDGARGSPSSRRSRAEAPVPPSRAVSRRRGQSRSRRRTGSMRRSTESSRRAARAAPHLPADRATRRRTKFVKWAADGETRKRKLSQSQMLRFQTLRFKKRGDLVMFATRYPGAFMMHFILQATQRAGLEPAKTHANSMETAVSRWADQAG